MAAFYVGQRVRVVRGYPRPSKGTYPKHSACFLGGEATVRGTMSQPNAGFWTADGCDISIQPDGFPRCGMVFSSMLEPIQPEGHKTVEWSKCLWQPEGIAA